MFFKKTIEDIRKEFFTWAKKIKVDIPSTPDKLEFVTRLDLSNLKLTRIPRIIDCMPNLEDLNLSNNFVDTLPWEFRNLKSLRKLNLSFNKFQEIPGVVCQLEKLEVLKIEANLLKKVNPAIANLTELKELSLFANQIVELPNEFGSLRHLTRLNLALNQLTSLPSSFSKLYNIVELELWLNKFDLIPEIISELPNLKDLYDTVDPDRLNKTLLWAVVGDNTQLAEKLIFYGADVNYELEDERSQSITTPLFESNSLLMIELLLEKGADPHLKREIVKIVSTKEGEKVRPTGKFETFLTLKHSGEVIKYLKSKNLLT